MLQFINPVTHSNKHFSVGFLKEKGYNYILNKDQGSFRRSPGLLLSNCWTLDNNSPWQQLPCTANFTKFNFFKYPWGQQKRSTIIPVLGREKEFWKWNKLLQYLFLPFLVLYLICNLIGKISYPNSRKIRDPGIKKLVMPYASTTPQVRSPLWLVRMADTESNPEENSYQYKPSLFDRVEYFIM